MNNNLRQKGDTIVEVLLATVIMASVIAGAYALTNRATRNNQAALERTYVSNLLKEQLELVRGAKSAGGGAWQEIINLATAVTPQYDINDCSDTTGSNPFWVGYDRDNPANQIDLSDTGIVNNYTLNNDPIPGDRYQMWIEPYKPAGQNEFIDFHARACWVGQGEIGSQRESMILRLSI